MADVVRPVHEFRLYRSGWSDELPYPDNQLWASGKHDLVLGDSGECVVNLEPRFGHAASWYQVYLLPSGEIEAGWIERRAMLLIDSCVVGTGYVPLSWYAGSPADWPSGIARYPETYGIPRIAGIKRTFGEPDPRGVWTLAVRRDQ